jgi:hypothetical protein
MIAICECVDVRIVTVKGKEGKRPAFILELYSEESKVTLNKYLGAKLTKGGNYSVKRNSDFARLYRLTIGNNPQRGFSTAQRLLKHFLGCRFMVEFEAAKLFGNQYLKVIHIEPVNPVFSNEWSRLGAVSERCRASPMVKAEREAGRIIQQLMKHYAGVRP